MSAITCKEIRYIKLGRGGGWEAALDRGELPFEHTHVPHALALSGDREQIKRHLMSQGLNAQPAAEDARELVDFYTLGADCLWITFARGHLWWTFAESQVFEKVGAQGDRARKSINGWRNTDVNGVPIRTSSLSSRLTKIAGYRRTICSVETSDYLLRVLDAVEDPIRARAAQAIEAVTNITAEAIQTLHWIDLETLVDLIFARRGWYRSSPIGGAQKLVDLAVEHVTTGEIAAVQVKAPATKAIVEDWIRDVDLTGIYDRLFFICPQLTVQATTYQDRQDIHVWTVRDLAKSTVQHGLATWVLEKIA